MKGLYVAFLSVVMGMFMLDHASSLVQRGDLGGNLAIAQSFGEPADDTSSDADAVPSSTVNNIAGNWSGPVVDSVDGDGTLGLMIQQKTNAASVKGTWMLMFTAGSIGGNIKGREKNGTGKLDLKKKSHHHGTCTGKADITVLDSTHINGTYSTTGGCGQHSTGTFSLMPVM